VKFILEGGVILVIPLLDGGDKLVTLLQAFGLDVKLVLQAVALVDVVLDIFLKGG
jgi:hypothetical protein